MEKMDLSKKVLASLLTMSCVYLGGTSVLPTAGAAENAAAVINQTERQKQAAKRQTKVVEEAFSKAIRNNNSVLAIELKMAAQHYQNLGLSAEKAGQMQLQAAKVAAKGQLDLAKQILDTQEKHILAANAALDHGKKLQGDTVSSIANHFFLYILMVHWCMKLIS